MSVGKFCTYDIRTFQTLGQISWLLSSMKILRKSCGYMWEKIDITVLKTKTKFYYHVNFEPKLYLIVKAIQKNKNVARNTEFLNRK